MKHFIELCKNEKVKANCIYCIEYFYNNKSNKIGDFSSCYYYSKEWYKYRRYRGKFIYSKQAHKEISNGIKLWYCNGKLYSSYEEYLLAVMG